MGGSPLSGLAFGSSPLVLLQLSLQPLLLFLQSLLHLPLLRSRIHWFGSSEDRSGSARGGGGGAILVLLLWNAAWLQVQLGPLRRA